MGATRNGGRVGGGLTHWNAGSNRFNNAENVAVEGDAVLIASSAVVVLFQGGRMELTSPYERCRIRHFLSKRCVPTLPGHPDTFHPRLDFGRGYAGMAIPRFSRRPRIHEARRIVAWNPHFPAQLIHHPPTFIERCSLEEAAFL